MNKKFTKTILSAAVAGLFLAGNASAQVKAASTSTEEYYTFGKQSDGTQYRLSRNDGGHSATFRLVKIDGENKEVAIPGLTDIEKDGSVYVTGYNGERTKVEAGDVSTMVKYILDEKNTGPYNKAVNKNSEANAPVKGYIDAASEAARTVALKPALGKGAVASEQYTVAVGEEARSTHKNSVALGTKSVTTRDNEVYIGYKTENGKAYGTRVLGGLSDGTSNSDAATVGQLNRKVGVVYDDVKARITVESEKQKKYTDQKTSEVNEKVESRTLVGVSSDGTLTRAEGAKNTISVNDGLVALSGRTDRIDAAVGAIDGRVTRNTQSIEKNSKAIAANTRTLQQHSARLDSQQRQINENHKEMKRAAAQSAALTGLFQPY
ncbi:hypothetical protein A13I_03992, partial [Escherichia coli KTE186]|uniref:hypothetical protein n=1 Tax=Escherichia coli TaxID=562 RepID=UPI00033A87D4